MNTRPHPTNITSRNTSGFGILALFLAVIVLGLLVVATSYVLTRQDQDAKENTATNGSQSNSLPQSNDVRYAKYLNLFSYPEEWGYVDVSNDTQSVTTTPTTIYSFRKANFETGEQKPGAYGIRVVSSKGKYPLGDAPNSDITGFLVNNGTIEVYHSSSSTELFTGSDIISAGDASAVTFTGGRMGNFPVGLKQLSGDRTAIFFTTDEDTSQSRQTMLNLVKSFRSN